MQLHSAIASRRTPNFFPGQTAAAAPNGVGQQIVYVPDASGFTSNVYRFIFTPDGTGGTINLNGVLSGAGIRSGTKIETVALPLGPFNDGALFLGYSDGGAIYKITNPATAPGTPVPTGKLFNSTGAISMAFNGNDLYISELGPPPIDGQFIKKGVVTVLMRASPSADNGGAVPVKRAIARLQTPQIIVENPGRLYHGSDGWKTGLSASSGRETLTQRSGRSGNYSGLLHGYSGTDCGRCTLIPA